MTRVLAVSPHLDDAVFSAGGTLATLAAEGAEVTVATVFTATVPDPQGFALACQLDKGLGPEVDYMALRRAEDRRACAVLGAEPRHLPLAEAPHRGYASARELFGRVREEDDAVAQVARVVGGLLDELRPDLLLAPQAVGGHVDHVAVVRALKALAPRAPVLWWRDHPYVIRPGPVTEPFAEFADAPRARVEVSPAAHARKTEAALAYESQLGFQFGGPAKARDVFSQADRAELFARLDDGAAVGLASLSPCLRL